MKDQILVRIGRLVLGTAFTAKDFLTFSCREWRSDERETKRRETEGYDVMLLACKPFQSKKFWR